MKDYEKKNYYELLGLEQTATEDEIKIAFKEIALVYHPDSNFFSEIVDDSHLSPEDLGLFKAITSAYQTLSNKEKRKEYDAKINKENISKGVHSTGEWIRPDGRSAPSSSFKRPKERAPTLTDLQNLQKKYEERSQVKLKTMAEIIVEETETTKKSNYLLILGLLILIIVLGSSAYIIFK